MARDRDAQLRNLIAGYGDSIRLSDIKANIAVLFVAIMMGTVLQFRAQYPSYLNVPVTAGAVHRHVSQSARLRLSAVSPLGTQAVPGLARPSPADFEFIADPVLEAEELPVRCALCRGCSIGRTSPSRPPIWLRWPRSSRAGCCSS